MVSSTLTQVRYEFSDFEERLVYENDVRIHICML